jgi:hypothetical protein
MIRSSLAVALALALGASAASAQPAGGYARLAAACKGDIAKLCPGVQQGGGRISQCLKAHYGQVSQGCKSAIAAAMAAQRAAKNGGGGLAG